MKIAAVRTSRAAFLIVLAAVVCGGQTRLPAAKASSAPKPVVAGIPNTDNIESVVRKLVASGAGEKKEFETTAQFEARQKALITDRRYAFVIETYGYTFSNGPLENKCGCEYDADTETMKAHIDSHAESFVDPFYSTSSTSYS